MLKLVHTRTKFSLSQWFILLVFTQEELAILTEKRLELSNIQQKVENLRNSLECFRNIDGDINCESVMRRAEEQLKMRNQHHFIHQQAGVLVYDC
jgi:hypothetical protein